jgi:cytochrome c5
MIKKSKTIAVIAIMSAIVSIVACTNQNKENITPDTSGLNCDSTGVTYAGYVKSVMDASCATSGCHSASSRSAGYDLSTYDGVKGAATRSKQSTSMLLGVINHQSGFTAMPQNGAKLSECSIEKITAWVNNGEPQ